MTASYGLHWFRRDLRASGNPALDWSRREHAGRVLGVFFIDRGIRERDDFSENRFAFFLETLAALREELRAEGGDLLVLDSPPAEGFRRIIAGLADRGIAPPATCSFNRDYEPYARERDAAVSRLLEGELGIVPHVERDHLVIEPWELLKPDGTFYKVFTPFAKRWFAMLRDEEVASRLNARSRRALPFALNWKRLLGPRSQIPSQFNDALDSAREAARPSVPLPAAGHAAAIRRLREFRRQLDDYARLRDLPGEAGTSRLSIYLKTGAITAAQVIAELDLAGEKLSSRSGRATFLRELAWREFYWHILHHCPRVERGPFLAQYAGVEWENRADLIEAWKQGRTGYPIVDAGMRQLLETGWMHNRARMITASFLVKDLHVDWRIGERHFMRHLLDGDLASNNGGWQWAASTGCDPQPFFRVFNPVLQGRKFDPRDEYVRRWVPEVRERPDRRVHDPIRPVVEHGPRAREAIALYRRAKERKSG